jgi:hypothetical protein
MKIADVKRGEVYKDKAGRFMVCVGKPIKCANSKSGLTAYCEGGKGKIAFTEDGSLRATTIREQRDFWKTAYMDLNDVVDGALI